jgi:protein arginine kinase
VIEDKIWRAYGLLRYARSLSFEEVMNLLSGVRLGVSMNLLSGLRVYTLNKIMIYAQDAHLEQAAGRPLGTRRATCIERPTSGACWPARATSPPTTRMRGRR